VPVPQPVAAGAPPPPATSGPLQPIEPWVLRPRLVLIAVRSLLHPSWPFPAPSGLRGLLIRLSVATEPRLVLSVLPWTTGPEIYQEGLRPAGGGPASQARRPLPRTPPLVAACAPPLRR
jgi:hypothetical protein